MARVRITGKDRPQSDFFGVDKWPPSVLHVKTRERQRWDEIALGPEVDSKTLADVLQKRGVRVTTG